MKRIRLKSVLTVSLVIGMVGAFVVLLACGGGGGGGDSAITTTTPTGGGDTTVPSSVVITNLATAVSSGNQESIEQLFVPESWNADFKAVFSSSETDLPALSSDISKAVLVKESGDTAIYRVFRIENGVERAFDIVMVKVNGEWKIYSM